MKNSTRSSKWIFFVFIFCLIFNINAFSQYNGDHYVGSGEEFETIKEAVDSLVSQGVDGATSIIVKTGTYNEQINITSITGASATNTITFQSETKDPEDVMIYYDATTSGNNYIVFFNGCDYVTFEYFKIVNSTLSSSYTSVIHLHGTAENNIIRYNTLIGESGSPGGDNEAVILMWDDILDNTEISHNTIQGGSFAIRFEAYGDGSGKVCLNTKINYNICESRLGIMLEVHNGVELIGNEVNTVVGNGIELLNCEEDIVIVNNKISSYSSAAHKGIYLDNCDGSIAFQGLVANNVVYVTGDNSDSNYGIHLNYSDYQNVYHNTVYLKNTGTGGYAFYAYGGNEITTKNNLFAVGYNGYAYGTNSGSNIDRSDFNNYYTSGNYIAKWNDTNIEELSNLQSANGKDAGSKPWNPSFIATDDISGLIPQTHWLDGTGDDLTGTIDYDIDSVVRPTSPDVGAYEFTAANSTTYSGALTIQASGGTFITFNEAVDSLKKLGVSGAVTISVETNTYTEQISVPAIPGIDATNTLTFQSASGDSTDVILQHSSSSSNNYVVHLNGADYITFKEMTFKSTGAEYAHIFTFRGRARSNTITNNVLDGNGNPANTWEMIPITAPLCNVDYLSVTNNIIKDGDRGIMIKGASESNNAKGVVISNNELTGYYSSIYVEWHTDFEISNNTFLDFTNTGNWFYKCTSPYKIESNRYSSTAVTERAIYVGECNGTGEGGLFYNNFIHVENSADIRGIWIYNSWYQSFYNNNINVISSNSGSYGIEYIAYADNGSNMIFKNNNIVVVGPGYPFYIESASKIVAESDNNNLYTDGTYIANWTNGASTNYNAVRHADIASLTAYSGKDANSLNYNPGYLTKADLHVNSYWIDGKGVQIDGGLVTDDIDGEARLNPPDIGADEYTSTLIPYDGEYTIGATGRFATFSIAIDSLIERGVLDTVIFKVQTGYYTEQFVIPQIAGVSADAVIIFESESGVASDPVITFNPTSSKNYLVKFDGADYVTFRNITFLSGTDQYARIISFNSKCENNNILGNIFSGRGESSTSNVDAILYLNGGIVNNLTITNNTFANGSLGIWMENSSSSSGVNLTISDNTFSCYHIGLHVAWFTAPKVENNQIAFISASGTGTNIQNCSSGATFGMSVQNNQIYSDTYADDYGAMYFNNCDANPSFPGIIANNVIRVGINGTRSMGIDVHESDYLNFYHNTVNITGNQTNEHAFVSNNCNYINIVNNNFVIKGDVVDKTSSHGWPIYIHNGIIGTCDYNNYYTAGKYLAYWAGTSYGTLAQLQAGTSKDVHSINYFPGFRGTNNLTMRSSWLDNKGTPLASVTDDIDGIARDGSNPDIGAYEYTATLSPIATGTYTVSSLGGDYPSLDSLTRALMERGIAGPVTFELLPGSYTNTNITVKDIPGTSAADTVVIQSQSGDPSNTVISHIQESDHNYILRLEGTDYLTIKDLTFNSGGTLYSRIFTLQGNSQYVKILGNKFNGVASTGESVDKSIIYVPADHIVDNLLIQGNTFIDNSYGIYFGGFSTYNHNSVRVINNEFNSQYRHIYFINTKKPYIGGNEMNNALERAIYLNNCDNDVMILNNKIFSTEQGYYGIYLYYCDGTSANKGLIANNFVSAYGTSSYNSFAIKLDQSNYQQVYYNTAVITGSGYGAAFETWSGGGNIQVANNIFTSLGSDTYTYKTQNTTIISASDYNDFYATSTRNIYYNGTDYATLNDYKAVSFMDGNSLDVNPVFSSSTDFHLLSDSVVGKAFPLVSVVATDIDGETRNASTPDIGADEFSCVFFPPPVVEDVTACSNDSIPDLTAEGTSIKWYSDPALTTLVWSANEYDPGITDAGVYTYYVTQSALECTSIADSVVLTIHAAPDLSADITHIDCQGTDYGTINLTVDGSTAAPFIYQWSNDEIYEDIDNLDAGDYIVTVEDLNGCIEIDTFTVTIPTAIILDISWEDTECDTSFGSATVVATGGEEPYDYRWNTGDSITVIDDLYAGVYVVTVTDNRACTQEGIATVSDIDAPVITLNSITDVSCYGGTNGAISITVSGDATPFSYVWSSEETTEDLNNKRAGSYELVVDDNEGCQSIQSFVIEEPDPVKINLNITETSCGQANGAAEAIVTGGTVDPDYTYTWSTGSHDSEIFGLNLGSYWVKATDDNSCQTTKYFSVSELGSPSVVIDSISEGTCGNPDGGIYISAYGSYETFTYLWNDAGSSTTQDLTGVNPGTYSVTVSDPGGCDAVQVATIEADMPEVNPICMVSVDSATNYNEIVWEKQYTTGVDYYKVYKQNTQGSYYEIGKVYVAEESVFVDEFSDVMQRPWRYKLAVVDDCGVESELSEHHKTMHLTINLGIDNSINLIWNHYEGFDYTTYNIHRKSNSGWELIASVPYNADDTYNSYTDDDPILDESLYYMIEIEHPFGCDPTKAGRNTSRSNISRSVQAKPDTEAPTSPTSLTTTEITDTTISLIWISSVDDIGVTAYDVYKNAVFLEEVNDTIYKATGLTKSTTYSFYVKAKDAAGNISAASNTINPTTTSPTGIDIFTDKSNMHITVFPNPNKGNLIISVETVEKQEFLYEIYSVNGIIIKNGNLGFIQGKYENTINMTDQENGLYFIKIYSKSGIKIERIILSK